MIGHNQMTQEREERIAKLKKELGETQQILVVVTRAEALRLLRHRPGLVRCAGVLESNHQLGVLRYAPHLGRAHNRTGVRLPIPQIKPDKAE